MWEFLEADTQLPDLEKAVDTEMQQNPDAQWQQEKAREIAEPLQKGKQGNWREIFTPKDRQVFHQIAGETLNAWGYPDNLSDG